MNMNKTLLVAGLLSAASFFGMQAMEDNGNKILAKAKLVLQEDDKAQFDRFCEELPARLAQVFSNDEKGEEEFSYFTKEYFRFIDYLDNPAVGAPHANFEANCKRLERVFANEGWKLVRPVKEEFFFNESEEFAPRRRSTSTLIRRFLLPAVVLGGVLVTSLVAILLLKGDSRKKSTPAVH